MQISIVFSQRDWPGAGDVDDCAVVSAIQAVNVTSPWLRLVGNHAFRRAARNPDDPDEPDGLDLAQIVRGIEGCYPTLRGGRVRRLANVSWTELRAMGAAGHPLSVALISARLPAPLRFGFDGRHQGTFVERPDGLWFANPLARPYSRWLRITWEDVRPAILAYGKLRTGFPCAYAVALPTDREARELLVPAALDTTPFDQDDVDAATAELQARIDAAREALDPPPDGG